ncbi:MAG TPA: hypothetical protein V6C96_04515 [Vampirovibrionales bacterium]
MSLAEIFTVPSFQSEFNHQDLSKKLSPSSIKWLRKQQILLTRYSEKWYCKDCVDFHVYEEFEGKLYKLCPENRKSKFGNPISEEEREAFYVDFEKLVNVICKKNQISLLNKPFGNSLLIGESQENLLIFTNENRSKFVDLHRNALLFLDPEQSFSTVYFIKPKKETEVNLSKSDKDKWKECGIQEVDLEKLINNFLNLPKVQAIKEGKLPISIQRNTAYIGDKFSTFTKTYAGILKKLIDREGKGIRDQELHDVTALRNYISKINNQLCKDCGLEQPPFIYEKNNVRLNTDFYVKK